MRKRGRRAGPAAARAVRPGYDHACVRQVGPDQAGFMRFSEREILPRLGTRASAARRRDVPAGFTG
jgi:hypothetical protein